MNYVNVWDIISHFRYEIIVSIFGLIFMLTKILDNQNTYNSNFTSVINYVYFYYPKYDTSHILLWRCKATLRKISSALKAEKGTSEPGGSGGRPIFPIFGRLVNSISARGTNYAPQHYHVPPKICRPSDIPVCSLVGKHFDPWNCNLHVWQKGLGWPCPISGALKKPSWDCKNFCTGEFLAKNQCKKCHQNLQRVFLAL